MTHRQEAPALASWLPPKAGALKGEARGPGFPHRTPWRKLYRHHRACCCSLRSMRSHCAGRMGRPRPAVPGRRPRRHLGLKLHVWVHAALRRSVHRLCAGFAFQESGPHRCLWEALLSKARPVLQREGRGDEWGSPKGWNARSQCAEIVLLTGNRRSEQLAQRLVYQHDGCMGQQARISLVGPEMRHAWGLLGACMELALLPRAPTWPYDSPCRSIFVNVAPLDVEPHNVCTEAENGRGD